MRLSWLPCSVTLAAQCTIRWLSNTSCYVHIYSFVRAKQVQVLSLLTLGQLEFDVALIFPDITITGSLHPGSQVTAAGVLASLNLPHDGVPQEMKVTEASFSAARAHGSYMADLSVDLGLKAGPVTIEEVCVRIAYTRPRPAVW